MFFHDFRKNLVLLAQFGFQHRHPLGPVLLTGNLLVLERSGTMFEKLLLPTVKHRWMDPILITKVRNRYGLK